MSPLRGYLAILGRRKWWVVVALVCASTGALAYSLGQAKRYEATATVLLSQNLAGALSGGLPMRIRIRIDSPGRSSKSLAYRRLQIA